MFKSLIAKIKAVMQKMGIIKNIKSISDIKALPVNDEFYNLIETVWLPLYKGHLEKYKGEPFHAVSYMTIEKGRRTRRMDSLNMPKVASEEMASLIFNEKCAINVSDKNLFEKINDVFEYNNFYRQFQTHLEYMFALGGMGLKAYIEEDRNKQKKIKIGYVTADCFIPIAHSNDEITEGVFLTVTRKGNKWMTLLEWHQWDGAVYVIKNQLFQSDNSEEIGTEVPLKLIYPGLEKETRIKGLSRPLFVYIKPNVANNFDLQSPLGISLFANAIDTIKALDTAFDSYNREFRIGKRRIIVPHTAIRTIVNRDTGEINRYFDANDEAYEALNMEDVDGQKIVDNTIELRIEEHVKAIQSLLDVFAMQIGFSPGVFSFDGQGVKTATEVVSENSKTFKTKNSHETIVEEGLKSLITSICEVAMLYDVFPVPDDYTVTIDFDDSIAEDRDANANFYLKIMNNRLMPRYVALMRILKMTEEQAKNMIQAVNEEQANEMPDIDQLYSGDS
ncbi:phage portal protein [Bacillus velezensis]|uniref:phage portal protein n=1 Tax=Bacillus TaxID=1386 RepID=UPI00065305C6|nr:MULTISPECIES: phage portal protein [Bacillus]KMN56398.1 portal protein [Bacillus sp. LK7]MDU0078255.1 phage portal protein [Bacillus sp. IG2]MDU0103994.1 phage portal protein [Bacillus sp. IS1]MDX7897482.1 phage portal protein [Bacillus velezensis]MDX8028512.1 phage portal protein [Bacillus velezensis]